MKRLSLLRTTLFILLALFTAASLAGFYLQSTKYQNLSGYTDVNLTNAFCFPNAHHLLGCDAYGKDLAERILLGTWHSISLSTFVVSLTGLLGLFSGTLLAFSTGIIFQIGMRFIDCFLAFPGLLLAILIAAVSPPSSVTIGVSLIVMGWAPQARLVNALLRQTLPLSFVEASKAAGASNWRILWHDLYPAIFKQLSIQWVFSISHIIIGEAGLSFLGLGGPLGSFSWGALIAEGRDYLVEAPHLSLIPGFILFLAALTFQLLAQELRIMSE